MLNERIKNKALGSYLCLAAAVVALITAVVFLATQATAAPLGHDGTAPGIVLLIGVAAAVVFFLFPVRFGALIQAAIYNVALYLVVVQLYFVFADIINKVTYAGGNAGLCVLYMAGTLIACLLSIAACFFPQTGDDDKYALDAAESSAKWMAAVPVAGVAAVAVVCALVLRTPGNSPAGPGASASGTPGTDAAEPFRFNYADNTFAGKSIEELAATPRKTWEAKEANGEVAYYFEGQYTEGFGTILDPACLDMYCCKDGSMYGSFSGPTTSVGGGTVSYLYGYWYNYDEDGEYNFVIHLAGNQNLDGSTVATNVAAGADADIFVFDTEHGAYSWEASMSYGLYGGMMTRNINIYGQEYAKAKSLTVDASKLPVFYTGDSFDPIQLTATAVRANDAPESIWNGRITYSGYDSQTPGTKTVTANFLGASTTFEVKVEQLVTENYSGSYELVKDGTPTATEAVLFVDYSHKVCRVTGADGTSISGTLMDSSDSQLTMILNGSDPLEVTISETDGVKQVTIPAHQEKVAGWGWSATYDIGECTLNIAG